MRIATGQWYRLRIRLKAVLEPLLGHAIAVPPILQAMFDRTAQATPMAADEQALKRWLRALPWPSTRARPAAAP